MSIDNIKPIFNMDISNNDIITSNITVCTNNDTLTFNNTYEEETSGLFLLKHLVMFTKCTTLSPTVLLYLKNEFPLIIEYKISSLGCIRLCLAPITNDIED